MFMSRGVIYMQLLFNTFCYSLLDITGFQATFWENLGYIIGQNAKKKKFKKNKEILQEF